MRGRKRDSVVVRVRIMRGWERDIKERGKKKIQRKEDPGGKEESKS